MHRLYTFLSGLILVLVLAALGPASGLVQGEPAQDSDQAQAQEVAAQVSSPVVSIEEIVSEAVLVEMHLADELQLTLESSTGRYPTDSREAWIIWSALVQFYRNRGHHPAWVSPQGSFQEADELFHTVSQALEHGLNPVHYPIDDLKTSLSEAKDEGPVRWVELDIELTHLYITYAKHLSQGRLDPRDLETEWHHRPRSFDFAQILEEALAFGDVGESLETMVPRDSQYDQLVAAANTLRSCSWPRVVGSFVAGEGDTADGLVAVREFLQVVGDLPAGPDAHPEAMDAPLTTAVTAFQGRHGLKPDGVVGPQTLRQMRVAARDRLNTVTLNMERRRWLGDPLPGRAAVVNIPEFMLRVFGDGDEQLRMRVIAGTDSNQTPAFADEITYLELNPVWHVPRSIATNEILPKVLEDSTYLATEVMGVYDSSGVRVDPTAIDWTSIEPESLGYRFRQAPGSRNPLGSIKFMFPNRFSVYLHDTQNTRAFNPPSRAFSHGCVRIQHPLSLGAYLLQDNPAWPGATLADSVATGNRQWVDLPDPMPIFIVYFTAFVEGGKMEFRDDIYERDVAIAEALETYVSPFQQVRGFVADLTVPLN